MLSFAACNRNVQEQQSEQKADINKVDINSITFSSTTLKNILNDYDENELRANDKYVNKYFSITGKFASADSQTSFRIYSYIGDQRLYFGNFNCECYIKEDILDSDTFNSLKEKLYLLNSDETVTVKGKITAIYFGEIFLDVYKIQ